MNGLQFLLSDEETSAIEAKFEHHRATVRDGRQLAPHADGKIIEQMSLVAFWASLRREEGRTPKVSLAFLPPDPSSQALRFSRPLPLTPDILTRLGPAVEGPGIHLGIWREQADLYLWGVVARMPELCFVLEVFAPGLLGIKYSRTSAIGKFGNIAVLEGDRVKIVDETIMDTPDCPTFLAPLIGLDPLIPWHSDANLLVGLAISMRSHEHGGTLLVVQDDDDRWRDSIAWPVPYATAPPFRQLPDLTGRTQVADDRSGWQGELRHAIESVAGLTAVDGATVINTRFEVLSFGAMIKRAERGWAVERLLLTEPFVGRAASIVDPVEIGHSRHLSAAQFVHDQRDALALVASQDGAFTTFRWSSADGLVHAFRIEALLM